MVRPAGVREPGFLFIIVLISYFIGSTQNSSTVVRIGGIFGNTAAAEESAFRYAVEYVNQRHLLGVDYTLDYLLNTTSVLASFESIQHACNQIESGIFAIVGPLSSTPTKAVHPIAQHFHIPQIAPVATNPLLSQLNNFPYLVRLLPSDILQSMALVDLVKYFGWKKMAIITSNSDYGTNGLVRFQAEAGKLEWRIVGVQQFSVTNNASQVDARTQLLNIRSTGVRVVILNCLAVFGSVVLKQARDLGMTSAGWAWIVTDGMTGSETLIESFPVPDFLQGLIGTAPVNGLGALTDFKDEWMSLNTTEYPGAGHEMDVYASSIADAVLTFAYAAGAMFNNSIYSNVTSVSLNCDSISDPPWPYGQIMLDYILQVNEDAVMDRLQFGTNQEPLHPKFEIVNMKPYGWQKVGRWNKTHSLEMTLPDNITLFGGRSNIVDYVTELANKTLRIVTIVEKPFVMPIRTPANPLDVQPDEVEGYVIDLLKNMSGSIGFKYQLYLIPDGQFGAKDEVTKQWNGMVKELVDRRADLAAASFTINKIRETDIDFTKPYLDLGTRFIMKKVDPDPISPWRFLRPFNTEVYLWILGTGFFVAIMVSLFNKLSPYDHHGGFVYNDHSEIRSQREIVKYKKEKRRALRALNFSNALWFSVGSLLQQGGDENPNSLSARIPTILWWLGIMIFVATYTANLAAFLTASRLDNTINSVEDLGSQTIVKYGTVTNSAPFVYFKDSNITLFKQMKEFMINKKTLVKSSDVGVELTRTSDYAFIWDSAVLDYVVEQQPCNLKSVGRLFGKIGYGFGLQKNSPYTEILSGHILRLREIGFMEKLQRKWYVERGECAKPEDSATITQEITTAGGQIGVEHMRGVFWIIYVGLGISVLVLVAEWILASLFSIDKEDPEKPHSFCEAISKRLNLMIADMKTDWLPAYCRSSCCGAKVDAEIPIRSSGLVVGDVNQRRPSNSSFPMSYFAKRKASSGGSEVLREKGFSSIGKHDSTDTFLSVLSSADVIVGTGKASYGAGGRSLQTIGSEYSNGSVYTIPLETPTPSIDDKLNLKITAGRVEEYKTDDDSASNGVGVPHRTTAPSSVDSDMDVSLNSTIHLPPDDVVDI
ncbi:glutamate receptor ionotropic, kainate 2-like [Tubulanus polymorphus]|uniref:glutamate receptor ionotropic, kainate 2-like n=1 Tax=Tubulanus polymorphus TaxID=672921 RepID=UPI003DA3ADE4